jgi:hypothetical protein
MKTDELIAALAADAQPVRRSPVRTVVGALAAGAAVALLGFLLALGVRPDIAQALHTWRFVLKLAIVAMAALLISRECIRLMRPLARPSIWPILAVLALLGTALAVELHISPSSTWSEKLIGKNAVICLTSIPLLSLAPLASLMIALRWGAPTAPVWTGALVGLASAVVGATFYALHCTDDSPLFVATWYGAAALIMTGIGAMLGARLLRW